MFLEGDLNDSANLKRIYEYITDTMLIAVYNDCINEYPDMSELEEQLTQKSEIVARLTRQHGACMVRSGEKAKSILNNRKVPPEAWRCILPRGLHLTGGSSISSPCVSWLLASPLCARARWRFGQRKLRRRFLPTRISNSNAPVFKPGRHGVPQAICDPMSPSCTALMLGCRSGFRAGATVAIASI